ncbi:Transcriptional activator RfaH [Pseudomonas sp. CMR5c]|nr:Transcriptional activator RfaH [Pseudomonas sp. CMR5c]
MPGHELAPFTILTSPIHNVLRLACSDEGDPCLHPDGDIRTETVDSMATYQPDSSSTWYLVQCKPRQDQRAEENLERQGFHCYRPQRRCQRLVQGRKQDATESLFPGYLFIALERDDNWAPLRSTRGVNRLVAFNGQPLAVAESLIDDLRQRVTNLDAPLLNKGAKVRISDGCFADLEAIFESCVGEERVVLLLNLLNKQQRIELPRSSIRKI